MNRSFSKYFFITLFLFNIFLAFSLDELNTAAFLNNDEIKRTVSGEIISRMFIKYDSRKENNVDNITIARTKYNDEDFSVYEVITDEKAFIPYKLTPGSKLDLYNILASFSKLNGMKYYSRRAGKVIPLIEESYRVTSMSGNKYDDIKYDKIQPKATSMFLQKDNKFGKLIYRSELYNEGDNFILVNTCLEPISKLIFNINNEQEYKIFTFLLYDKKQEGYFLYSYQVMRVRVELILKNKMLSPTTFANRMRASTVHLAKLLGIDWSSKMNPWPGMFDKYE
jgi:hypothetical protein